MERRLRITTLVFSFVVALLVPLHSSSDPVRSRILDGVHVEPDGSGWTMTVSFSVPIRYVRHAPPDTGDQILIQLDPLRVGQADQPASRRRESLRLPADLPVPLDDVTYDGSSAGVPRLEIRFARDVSFKVRQGEDLRSLTILLRTEEEEKAQLADSPPDDVEDEPTRTVPADPMALAGWMEMARQALTHKEYPLAISYLTKVLSFPENDHSAEAQELLGLARERNGQRAHAKAEYERYLERYPDGEGARRVRQRLNAMLTARAQRSEPLRTPRPWSWERDVHLDLRGSVSASYRRAARIIDQEDEVLTNSTLYSDFDLIGLATTREYTLRGRLSGRFSEDFLETRSPHEMRMSSAFVEFSDRERGIQGTLGRQSRSSGGVLGRFDGAYVSYRMPRGWRVSAVAGFPIDDPASMSFDSGKNFHGVSLDMPRMAESLDIQLFAIQQFADGMTDRLAIGSELRYSGEDRFLAAFVDYDAYFNALNTAFIVANWRPMPRLELNALVDHRHTPILLTTNGIQGQNADRVGDLRRLYDSDEIESLARDRTARQTALTLGGTYRLTDRVQLAADVTTSRLSGTPSSGGVEGMEGTGWEVAPSLQVIASDLIKRGDMAIFGVFYRNDRLADTTTLSLLTRFPLTERLRLNPLVRVDFRVARSGEDRITVRPLLRVDYHFWKLVLDVEAGMEWRDTSGAAEGAEDLGYSFLVGLRHDF